MNGKLDVSKALILYHYYQRTQQADGIATFFFVLSMREHLDDKILEKILFNRKPTDHSDRHYHAIGDCPSGSC